MDELPQAPSLRTVLEQNGRLLARRQDGWLALPGQLYFDFATYHTQGIRHPVPRTRTAEEWFDPGYWKEKAGHLDEAVSAYQPALLTSGPNADVCCNLATVAATRKRGEAKSF